MDRIVEWLIRCIIWFSGFTKTLSGSGLCRYEEWEPGRTLKVLLAGYNGARNTGADVRVIAIAEQLIELFGKDQVEITVMTMDPDNMKGYFPETVRLLRFSPIYILDLYRACSTHHAVIISEGSTLKSTFANALAMFYIEAAGIMQRQGKPSIAYGTEVGTMDGWLEKMARKYCAETYFITRTKASKDRLEALGLKGHAGTDTAWRFDGSGKIAWAKDELKKHGWDGVQPIVGCAVIDPFCWPVKASLGHWILAGISGDRRGQYRKWYFFSRSEDRRRRFKRYIAGVAAAADHYAEKNNAFVAVIGMEALDREACECLAKRLRAPHAIFCSADHDAFEMTGVLRCLSELVTSRYHAAVLSMDRAIPIVSVSMDERLDELMAESEMDPDLQLRTDDPKLRVHLYTAMRNAAARAARIRDVIPEKVSDHMETLCEMGVFLKMYLS